MTAPAARARSASAASILAMDWLRLEAPDGAAFTEARGVSVRRQRSGPQAWSQPALDEVLIVANLGTALSLTLCSNGRMQRQALLDGDLIVIPAGQANDWAFDGPTDLALVCLAPAITRRAGGGPFARRVGLRDPYLTGLIRTLVDALTAPDPASRLYLDSLAIVLARALPVEPAPPMPVGPAKGGLPGWKLKRVLEHLDARLAEAVAIEDLMAVTGLSRAQLFRAFKASTGETPLAFVARLRRERGFTT